MALGFDGRPEDELNALLISSDRRLVRPVWAPVWSDQPSGRPKASKFGGSQPYRRPGFVWPRCTTCHGQMTFMCQLEASTLPEEAQKLCKFDSGLLQVFYCKCDCPFEEFKGLWVVQDDKSKSVPSLLNLAASALKKTGSIPTGCLPAALEKEARDFTEEYEGEVAEEREVAGWENLTNEVPDSGEWSMALLEAGLITLNQAIGLEPEELIAEEHRQDIGEVKFPEGFPSSGLDGIKLGGWISWGMDVDYPECPDCDVRMTTPLLELRMPERVLKDWEEGYDHIKGLHVNLCPRCQRPALAWQWKGMQEMGFNWG